jgi:hypothetical protein
MYKDPPVILATKKNTKWLRSCPWLQIEDDVVELARWEKARRSSGWAAVGLDRGRRSGLLAIEVEARRSSMWRCAGRRGGGVPAVKVEARRPSRWSRIGSEVEDDRLVGVKLLRPVGVGRGGIWRGGKGGRQDLVVSSRRHGRVERGSGGSGRPARVSGLMGSFIPTLPGTVG